MNFHLKVLWIWSQNFNNSVHTVEYNYGTPIQYYNAYQDVTDYGSCCHMIPYLDFINNETIPIDPSLYTGDHYHSIPYGAKNSVRRGIKLIIDVESYDYAYYPRGSRCHIRQFQQKS